ncbi:MAG: hypothetical protein J6P03_05940, partial [Opitutales bacterium]|nr:hypothetical protein [Opitutales bacterium]
MARIYEIQAQARKIASLERIGAPTKTANNSSRFLSSWRKWRGGIVLAAWLANANPRRLGARFARLFFCFSENFGVYRGIGTPTKKPQLTAV